MTEEKFERIARELLEKLERNTRATEKLATATEALVAIMFQIKQSEGAAGMLSVFVRGVGSKALKAVLERIR